MSKRASETTAPWPAGQVEIKDCRVTTVPNPNPWMPGLPPGALTQEMLDTFEAYFSPGGAKWHRRRTDDEIARIKDARHD